MILFKNTDQVPTPEIPICEYCYEEDFLIRKSDSKCMNCILDELDHRISELENER